MKRASFAGSERLAVLLFAFFLADDAGPPDTARLFPGLKPPEPFAELFFLFFVSMFDALKFSFRNKEF